MTDDINKKITIDVEVTTNGQQQIDHYKASFDNLRSTIGNLGKPLDDLSVTLKNLDQDISKIADSTEKSQNKIADATSTFALWNATITTLRQSFNLLTASISAGLSILITFGPEILKWIGNMLKGNTTLNSLNQTLRDHKKMLEAVNVARLQGDQNAQQELVHLKLLYNATQDHNLSLKERKKAVDALQAQYPDYFSNLSSEVILAGKAAKAYTDLKTAIIASSRAKAAENLMEKNSERQIGDDNAVQDLKKQLYEKNRELQAAEKDRDETLKYSSASGSTFGTPNTDSADDAKIERLKQEATELQQTIWNASNDSLILDKKNQALADDVSKNIEKNGVKIIATQDKQTTSLEKYSKKLDEVNSKQKTVTQDEPSASTSKSALGDPAVDSDDQALLNTPANTEKTIDIMKVDARKKEMEADKKAAEQLKDFEIQTAQQVSSAAFSILQNSIRQQADAKIAALEDQKNNELSNTNLTSAQKIAIEAKFKKQEAQIKAKAFKEEQEASIAQAVINGALAITKATSQTGVLSPFVVPGIIAETAIEIAKIESQKPPAYASGGLHYSSDGRGGVLPGYSRTDNTNAWLRSGEGVVVSEAMRDPWARNLVSAINVGFGGRDFSIPHSGRGYAVGGIFTDGGDANRYYNAPVNDQKNLANTIAYQMINNFPPVYVDVKDINNQQNILAQTINRVNL
jgi:hypothetical protein